MIVSDVPADVYEDKVDRNCSLTVPATVDRCDRIPVAAVKVIRSAQLEPLVLCWILKVADPNVEATEVTCR